MTTVTVDLKDLETLVMATAIIKTIESALQQRKNDPFVKPHLDFTEAHDRLASVMRNATRAEAGTLFGWDDELTKDEIEQLQFVDGGNCQITPAYRLKEPAFDSLAAKGCIVLGQLVNGVVWAGANRPELQVDPKGFAVKITDRGREKLRTLKDQEKK